MNLLMTINNKYVEQLIVLLNSIKYSNSNEVFDIYILYKELDDEKINNINKEFENFKNFSLNFINIPKSEINSFPVYEKRYPEEIYFRLFASKYLPQSVNRVLYLDSDTVVINNLKTLYNMDFEGNLFIASTHIKKKLHKLQEIRLGIAEDEPYINTGVILMNLGALRKLDIEKEISDFVKENKKN